MDQVILGNVDVILLCMSLVFFVGLINGVKVSVVGSFFFFFSLVCDYKRGFNLFVCFFFRYIHALLIFMGGFFFSFFSNSTFHQR